MHILSGMDSGLETILGPRRPRYSTPYNHNDSGGEQLAVSFATCEYEISVCHQLPFLLFAKPDPLLTSCIEMHQHSEGGFSVSGSWIVGSWVNRTKGANNVQVHNGRNPHELPTQRPCDDELFRDLLNTNPLLTYQRPLLLVPEKEYPACGTNSSGSFVLTNVSRYSLISTISEPGAAPTIMSSTPRRRLMWTWLEMRWSNFRKTLSLFRKRSNNRK